MIVSSHIISILFLVMGFVIVGLGGWLLANSEVYGTVILSREGCGAMIAMGICIALQGLLQYKAATGTSACPYYTSGVIAISFIIIQIGVALAILIYLASLEQVQ